MILPTGNAVGGGISGNIDGHHPRHLMIHSDSYIPHSPIEITSNDDFVTQGWPGNGTEVNPYVIEGLDITNVSTCISISDTDVYFEIRECFISAPAQSSYFGISLTRVLHGTIKDCISNLHSNGIYLHESDLCSLTNNTVADNQFGFYLDSSSLCVLINNTANSSSHYGFYLRQSSFCVLTNNTATGNNEIGFWIYLSPSCNLTGCSAMDNEWHGFFVSYSTSCILMNNTAMRNSDFGFFLSYSSSCDLINNTAVNNYQHGFILYYSDSCTITQSSIIDNGWYGICLSESSSCMLTNNTLKNCGLVISGTSRSNWLHVISNTTVNDLPIGYIRSVWDTNIDGRQYSQVILTNCTGVTVENGIFKDVSIGIQLGFCIGCSLTNNTASYNIIGFSLLFSSGCTLMNNTSSENMYGIYLSSGCSGNLIFFNRFFLNIELNAYDNSGPNNWDNGIHGNFWDDFNGTGMYSIAGAAESFDRHPYIYGQPLPTNTTTTTLNDGFEVLLQSIVLGLSLLSIVAIVVVVVLKIRPRVANNIAE
ncbi:MAG: right-handed parallel beta-helix repeat-containing protein [Candidatus Thorarchaeota archaeon]|nr:right-handed parallel beta-helix repeat-containing protein [Candidatus Thorarchaeota archaeon]